MTEFALLVRNCRLRSDPPAARATGIKHHQLEVGVRASPVIPEQSTALEALRFHSVPRAVIIHGKSRKLRRG